MDQRKIEIERFEEVLREIRAAFPSLRIEVGRSHPDLEASADIPRQPGLDFELHLTAGPHSWVEWFPCGDQDAFEKRLNARIPTANLAAPHETGSAE